MRRGTRGKPEGLGELAEKPLLRGGLGQFTAERFARVGQRVLDQILFFAALRHRDLDPVSALGAERFGEQRAVLDAVRDQDQARAWLVVVELGEKGGENFTR